MGDYSVSCGISGLSLIGEPVVLVPLVASWETKDRARVGCVGHGGSYIVGNPAQLYEPMCLPIFGKLGDVGMLEEVEKNLNTECIEKYFGMTIEAFVEIIAYGADKKVTNPILKASAGMYIHREVWDEIVASCHSEYECNYGMSLHDIEQKLESARLQEECRKAHPEMKSVYDPLKYGGSESQGWGFWSSINTFGDINILKYVLALYGIENLKRLDECFRNHWRVWDFMGKTNKTYMPTRCGPQYPFDSDPYQRKLNKWTRKILKDRKREDKEND
jgi:hypothetical protein